MLIGFHVHYPLFLSDVNEPFFHTFSKNTQTSNFIQIRPVGAERRDEENFRCSQFFEGT